MRSCLLAQLKPVIYRRPRQPMLSKECVGIDHGVAAGRPTGEVPKHRVTPTTERVDRPQPCSQPPVDIPFDHLSS